MNTWEADVFAFLDERMRAWLWAVQLSSGSV